MVEVYEFCVLWYGDLVVVVGDVGGWVWLLVCVLGFVGYDLYVVYVSVVDDLVGDFEWVWYVYVGNVDVVVCEW